MRYPPIYHTEDDGADPQGGSAPAGKPSDVLERYGRDALKLAEKLAEVQEDNYKLREERRRLREERTALTAKLPADGTVILSADDAAALEGYRALGKADDLSAALAERQTLAQQIAARDRADALRIAATVSAYDADVLATLAGDLPLAVKDVGEGKDKKPIAFITDAAGKEHRLADYAAAQWGKFLPSLAPKTAPGDGVGSPANGRRPVVAPNDIPRPRTIF